MVSVIFGVSPSVGIVSQATTGSGASLEQGVSPHHVDVAALTSTGPQWMPRRCSPKVFDHSQAPKDITFEIFRLLLLARVVAQESLPCDL